MFQTQEERKAFYRTLGSTANGLLLIEDINKMLDGLRTTLEGVADEKSLHIVQGEIVTLKILLNLLTDYKNDRKTGNKTVGKV
jgi:hypothetical protein